jgi:hypothetical protein
MNDDSKKITDDEVRTLAAKTAQRIENTMEALYDSLKTNYREKTERDESES